MELFMNPALLAGGLLAAAPIILHLVMKQKPKRIPFAALQFLKVRQQKTTRRLNLQHLLLLALRVLCIVLMALALARPRLPAGTGLLPDPAAPVAAVLVFDTSPRMGYVQNQKSRLDDARTTAEGLLSQLPRESQVAVLDSQMRSSLFQVDIPAAVARIQPDRLKISPMPQPLGRLVEQAWDLLTKVDESRKLRKEVYIFTDLAAGAWREADFAKVREAAAKQPDVSVYLVDVGVEDPQNFALGDVRLSAQAVSKNLPVSVRCELRRTGPAAQRTVEMTLTDPSGQTTKRGEAPLSLGVGESKSFELPLSGLDVGLYQGELSLVGGDSLAIDDKRYFTIQVQPPTRVLLVASVPEAAVVVDQALAPERIRQRGQARFETEFATFEQLPQMELVGRFPMIWLIDPPPLPSGVWRALQDFATRGGGVAIFLGRGARDDPAAFNAQEPQWLLAGKLALESRRPQGDLCLAPEAQSHPMLEKFIPLEGKVPWRFLPVFRYWLLEDQAPEAQVVIPLSNTKPFMLDRPVGQGRAITTTSPMAERPDDPSPWNALPRQPLWPYMMLVDQLGRYMAGASAERLNFAVGQTAVVRTPANLPKTSLVVTLPGGEKRSRTTDPRQIGFAVPEAELPGHYRVKGGEKNEVDAAFSANLAADQSDLSRADAEAVKKALGSIPFHSARELTELRNEQSLGREGRPLFPILLLLVAGVLALESFVSNRFYQMSQPPAASEGGGTVGGVSTRAAQRA